MISDQPGNAVEISGDQLGDHERLADVDVRGDQTDARCRHESETGVVGHVAQHDDGAEPQTPACGESGAYQPGADAFALVAGSTAIGASAATRASG